MAEIADRIAAVRKEAENLKELVKQKRDSLADTTRKLYLLTTSQGSSSRSSSFGANSD
jgi:hypothetical protein